MWNRKLLLSILLILAGASLLGAAYATKWDGDFRPGSIQVKDHWAPSESNGKPIGMQKASRLAEQYGGERLQSIERRNMHGYLVYLAEVRTPERRKVKIILDAGTGDILFDERDSNR